MADQAVTLWCVARALGIEAVWLKRMKSIKKSFAI